MLEDILAQKLTVKFAAARHGDLSYFICDTSKALRELGWHPQIKPRDGISKFG